MPATPRRNWSARIAIAALIVAVIVLVGYPLSIGPAFVVWSLMNRYEFYLGSYDASYSVFHKYTWPMFEWSNSLPDPIEGYWWLWTAWWRALARQIS